jgi:UPF0716 family protein affecting phage T7 exclusion
MTIRIFTTIISLIICSIGICLILQFTMASAVLGLILIATQSMWLYLDLKRIIKSVMQSNS